MFLFALSFLFSFVSAQIQDQKHFQTKEDVSEQLTNHLTNVQLTNTNNLSDLKKEERVLQKKNQSYGSSVDKKPAETPRRESKYSEAEKFFLLQNIRFIGDFGAGLSHMGMKKERYKKKYNLFDVTEVWGYAFHMGMSQLIKPRFALGIEYMAIRRPHEESPFYLFGEGASSLVCQILTDKRDHHFLLKSSFYLKSVHSRRNIVLGASAGLSMKKEEALLRKFSLDSTFTWQDKEEQFKYNGISLVPEIRFLMKRNDFGSLYFSYRQVVVINKLSYTYPYFSLGIGMNFDFFKNKKIQSL